MRAEPIQMKNSPNITKNGVYSTITNCNTNRNSHLRTSLPHTPPHSGHPARLLPRNAIHFRSASFLSALFSLFFDCFGCSHFFRITVSSPFMISATYSTASLMLDWPRSVRVAWSNSLTTSLFTLLFA